MMQRESGRKNDNYDFGQSACLCIMCVEHTHLMAQSKVAATHMLGQNNPSR